MTVTFIIQQSVCENDFENRVITATAYSRWFCKGNVVDQISQAFMVNGCDFVHYGLQRIKRSKSSMPGEYRRYIYSGQEVRLELRKASDNSLVVRRDEFFFRICFSVTIVSATFCQEVFSLANTSQPQLSITLFILQ